MSASGHMRKWTEGKNVVSVSYRLEITRDILIKIQKVDDDKGDVLYTKLWKIDGIDPGNADYDGHFGDDCIFITIDGEHYDKSRTWEEIERVINEHIGTTPEGDI